MLTELLRNLIDYAGLFPPAGLPMNEAVANYSRYLESDERWMLARFITPVARLGEFEREATSKLGNPHVWQLSVLTGADVENDIEQIAELNRRLTDRAVIDTIEAKASDIMSIQSLASTVPDEISLFIEIPVDNDPGVLVEEIGEQGRMAKIRTGGVTPDAFPSAEHIVRFIRRCREHGVPFKATAGLHHPLRSVMPLTYEPDAPRGTMNGFLNVFLAATLIDGRLGDDEAIELLETTDATAFRVDDDTIRWKQHSADTAAIELSRARFSISFGSCSFEEPIADLRNLGWL